MEESAANKEPADMLRENVQLAVPRHAREIKHMGAMVVASSPPPNADYGAKADIPKRTSHKVIKLPDLPSS